MGVRQVISTVLLCVASWGLYAQETRVIDGRKYHLHTVEAGQTLFAISRHYAVPVDALIAANPGSDQSLSIGQMLLVPQDAQVKKELRKAPELRPGELVHRVAKKETLFGLARRYGVDENDLLERNPELNKGVREGMEITIPLALMTKAAPEAVKPAVDDGMRSHLVIAGETLYSLSKAYSVEPDAIKAANGGLPDGLKAGAYVRIPSGKPAEQAPVVQPPPGVRTDGSVQRVALMLPFSGGAASSDGKFNATTEAAVQFYAGAQLAFDSLVAQGMKLEVGVFDTGDGAATWNKLMASDEVRGYDLYLGPFHRGAIEALVRVAGGAHVVCPSAQSNKVLLGNATVSKVSGGRADHMQQIARFTARRYARENVVLWKPDVAAEKALLDQVQRQLNSAFQQNGRTDSVRVVAGSVRDMSVIDKALVSDRLNVVVVPSDDVEFVTAVVGKLRALVGKYRILVIGSNAWPNIDNVTVQDLVKLNVHIPASQYVDHVDPRTTAFVAAFRERFKNEPGEYAFLGYDIARFYLAGLQRYGRRFPERFNDIPYGPLHMALRLEQAGPENGYRNDGGLMLEYKDMMLRPVK